MFTISKEAIPTQDLSQAMQNPQAGALVIFDGRVRNLNDGKVVESLEYEAWEALCIKEATKIIHEAQERFEILEIRCVHRVGHLMIGDCAVWLGVLSAHREDGFAACRYVIDEVKHRLPIWKREHYSEERSEWVLCEACASKGC
jgi:molybdopterin synthase catalytic subunit